MINFQICKGGTLVRLFAAFILFTFFVSDLKLRKSGFTVEAQIGPVYVRENADNSELQTLLNLKVGWSF